MIRTAQAADVDAILRINRAGRPGVAALEHDEVLAILASEGELWVWDDEGDCSGYVIVYANAADYDGEEFAWLRANLPGNFLYIDQIAIAPEAQGEGIGRGIYGVLKDRARDAGIERLACEVNLVPPNPASLAFHGRLGFVEAGRMNTSDGREVCLLTHTTAASL